MKVAHNLDLDFDNGMRISIDTAKTPMSDEQRRIVGKLAANVGSVTTAECTEEGGCPAQRVLTDAEFQQIRTLKATLGTVHTEGVVCDFCLKVVVVNQ